MKVRFLLVCVLAWFAGADWARGQDASDWQITKPGGTRFLVVDVLVDSGAEPLAAYQLTIAARGGQAKIVGIEGGEGTAFQQPPYYDAKAIQRERAILAAFQTLPESQLPRGKVRVATVHWQVKGAVQPEFVVQLQTAAGADGHPIRARAILSERNSP